MKIFITLGTQDKAFDRLINEAKKIKGDNEIVIQCGYTKGDELFKCQDYYDNDTFINLIKDSDIIITHGGVGSIIQALNFNKKVLAVPRLSKYGEHTNDHQIQIVKEFEKEGYLIGLNDKEDINEKLLLLDDFKPKTYKSNKELFINKLNDYISCL